MKRGIFISVMPGQRILNIVTKKLIPERKLPDPGNLHAPDPIIDPDPGIVLEIAVTADSRPSQHRKNLPITRRHA